MIRGTSSGADDVIGNGKCVVSGHLREEIWMIASKKPVKNLFNDINHYVVAKLYTSCGNQEYKTRIA